MPIEDAARVVKAKNPRAVFHTDAVQAAGMLDRLDGADFVVDVHDADERGGVCDSVLEVLEVDEPLAVHAEVCDAEAFFLQPLGRMQDGVVLDGGRDYVIAAALAAGGVCCAP